MLNSFFLNPWMLLGLSAVLIPPIIHLLNRRRYEVVDWGAMQFLQLSEVTRRRLFWEELLLMLLRMGLITVLVLALAGPFVTTASPALLGPRANRDVVLVFDGSLSMGSTGKEGIPHEKAKEWARAFVAELTPGDSVAILQAGEQVVPVLAEPSHDHERVQNHIAELPAPSGGCNWPLAVQTAASILESSQRAQRDMVLLSDGQRQGFADRESLFRWSLTASSLTRGQQTPAVRLWVVNVVPERPADPPNWSLLPLETDHLLTPAGREVTFRTALDLHGQKAYTPPHRVRLEVDGRFVRNLDVPSAAALQNGRVPFSFKHLLATPGSHLITVVLEPDPPREQRPAEYTVKDELPGDNRQDFAVEVGRALSVLIVDGKPTQPKTGRDFLREALEARDPTPTVRTRVVSLDGFDPALLTTAQTSKDEETVGRPRVLILRDVPRLTAAQQEAVSQFLADGGGVLVTLGPHVDAEHYNTQLYRGGTGWLPAHLDGAQGEATKPESAAHPAPGGSEHPALRLFLEKPSETPDSARFPQLGRVRFPRWWKLSTPGRNSVGVQVAVLRTATDEYPFLVERVDPQRAGRLLVCAVPLDDAWGTDVIRHGAFLPLAHELVYYLAGARAAEYNLEPGQPLRYRLASLSALEQCKLQTPLSGPKPLTTDPTNKNAIFAAVERLARGSLLRIDGTRQTGVYRLRTPESDTICYVVQPKSTEESDLTPCSDEDRVKVAERVPGLRFVSDRAQLSAEWISTEHRQELWNWLLLGLIALLCGEVWLTRRIVKRR
jgi:hypothetical protein